MKTATIGAVAIAAAIGAPAHGADMTLNAPPPIASWTGPYVGATLGEKWAKDTWTTTSLVTPFPTTIDASSPRNYDLSGFRAGGYLGYDWQFASQWVAFSTATNSVVRTGWIIGAGLEARVWGNWTLSGEYRYAYFGAWGDQLNLSLPGSANVVGYRSKFATQILTLGVAYKFAL